MNIEFTLQRNGREITQLTFVWKLSASHVSTSDTCHSVVFCLTCVVSLSDDKLRESCGNAFILDRRAISSFLEYKYII